MAKKQLICETPRDLETSCTLEPILSAVCEKNLFCFIHSSASRKLHFSHTTGSHANLTMQVTQWQIAVQMQASSETPHDLKTPSTLESILQVVWEKTFFCFIRSSAKTWVVHQSPEALFYKTSFFSCESSLIIILSIQCEAWSFDRGRYNFGSFWVWE